MNEIIYQKSYREYKEELDGVLQRTAESFVRIGYLLKVARDTNVLTESGYDNVVDFAKAEYGIDKTVVSRFIRINDKFSEGGYSDRLQENYKGYGYAKLALMLQLPDAVNEILSPEYSKSEIQAIKDEVDEESKVTDIERMLEAPEEAVEQTTIERLIEQLGEDDPELYVSMHRMFYGDDWTIEDIKEIMAPQEEKVYSIRIRGIGRILMRLNVNSEEVTMVNTRTNEKETCGWGDLGKAWIEIAHTGEVSAEKSWSTHYCREFPKVAPVQPESVQKSSQTVAKPQKTATKVQKAPKVVRQETLHDVEESIPKPDPMPEEPEKETAEQPMERKSEESLEGQQSIENFPEYMPEEQTEVIPPEETISHRAAVSEETVEEPEAAVDQFHQTILDHIENLKRHVLEDEWKMARMDTEMIQDAINRGEDMEDMEDMEDSE